MDHSPICSINITTAGVAIATPFPKYKHGTEDHPGGLAILGDGGKRELVELSNGKAFISSDKPTLNDLPKHSKVQPDADKLNAAMQYAALKILPPIPAGSMHDKRLTDELMKQYDKQTRELRSIKDAINSKPTAVIRNTLNGWSTGYRNDQRWVEWVNRNMQS